MSLQGALAVAGTGLHAIERSLTVVSQNVANAGTTGYTREVAAQSSLTANGVGIGVRVLPATRDVDLQLQAATIRQNATVGGQQLTQSALQAIDLVQGTPGGSGDLASLIGAVQDAFTTLQAAPESQTQQSKVVATAQALTEQVNALSQAYTTARQDAQDDIVADVRTVKATLDAIGSQSNAIMRLKSSGQSTADLENQRDASLQTLSQMLDIRCLAQPSGDVLVLTPSGLRLPIHGEGASLATGGSNLAPGASYPASVPAITLGGVDVTSTLVGGRLGAAVMLRDKTLPTYQAELDEFAATLTDRFDQQGLRLFSDQTGSVPTTSGPPVQAGYVGYSAVITVNPAITAQPALVRDGTHPVPGSATGAASFVPNPSNGPSGFTAMITRVLKYALGTQAQDGVAQREVQHHRIGAERHACGAIRPTFGPGRFRRRRRGRPIQRQRAGERRGDHRKGDTVQLTDQARRTRRRGHRYRDVHDGRTAECLWGQRAGRQRRPVHVAANAADGALNVQSVAPYSATHIGGALGAAVGQSAVVRGRLDRLTEQASDGRTSETFAGLGGGAATSLALTPAVATNANWQGAIEMATGRMGVAQTALSRISDIASRFYALTDTLNGLNASNVSSLAGAARDALTEVAGLMNTTDGGVYVFSGQDSASAPIPDADQMASSGFAVAIANAVAGLASNGANATAAATLNIAASNTAGVSPFSAALSQDAATVNTLRPSATVGRAGSVPTGIMASANGDIASTGGSTTGSYMRDILRGLATLAALSPEQIPAAGFGDLVSDTRASLGDAVTAINQDAGVMGDRQTALAAAKTTLAQASTALQAQVSAVQDIDMAATLSELTRVQTQLQSSYQIIGMLQGLSLTKYLSG